MTEKAKKNERKEIFDIDRLLDMIKLSVH